MTARASELTPRGHGAVSVIRVRGEGAIARVLELAPRARGDVREPQVVRLRALGEDLDEAIVCVISMSEVELHVHGSPPLVRRILSRLGGDVEAAHVVPTAPGAEVRDVATAEDRARQRLGGASSDSAARILLDQAEGALRTALHSLAGASSRERGDAVEALLERGRVARYALEPIDVALAGAVNAGKSTLFNALLGEERTIVSEHAGTTRDVVRERALIGAYPVVLIDTPGASTESPACDARTGSWLRENGELDREGRANTDTSESARRHDADALERASQRESLRARDRAELVLWLRRADSVRDDAAIDAASSAGRVRLVLTQIDRLRDAERARFPLGISALREPESARERIRAIFLATFALPAEPWCCGSAVPFDAALRAGVRELALDAPAPAWRRSVDALLGSA
jgi:tRNA U34 5-carboxymethylaminomethyl modifying GTPase MnmE/TrmE